MKPIRPFAKDDIPQVAGLFQKVFFNNGQAVPSTSKLKAYFEDVFFHHPQVEEDITSLVYETGNGQIIGFIGVVPQRMLLHGRPIRAAISMHFMVEPGSRSTLAGVQLLKTFFSGPQDMSLTDSAGNIGRKVWEGLGGSLALAYSINWMRVLRPSNYMLRVVTRKNRLLQALSVPLGPLCPMMDALVRRAMPHRFGHLPTTLQESELDQETLLTGIARFSAGDALQPAYDQSTLPWLLTRAEQLARPGKLHKIMLRNANGELVGWYLYALNTDGMGEVLQIVGQKKSYGEILDHLFHHGWRQGAIAFSGRLRPKFAQEFSDKHCFLDCSGPWLLVHSKHPDLLQVVYQGDAFLTRLEGEWCLRFPC